MYICVITGFHIDVTKIGVNIGGIISVNIVGAKCEYGITRFALWVNERWHRHAVCTYILAGVWQI